MMDLAYRAPQRRPMENHLWEPNRLRHRHRFITAVLHRLVL